MKKKITSMILSLALLVSAMTLCSFTAFATGAGSISLTFDTAASGENWTFDGNTLTLNGATIDGDLDLYCGLTGHTLSVVTTADSSISGNINTIFDNYNYAVNYTFTAQNNAVFSLGGMLSGGGNNNETITVDGATVAVGALNLGGSGSSDSFVSVMNGGSLTVDSQLPIQDVSVTGASELTVNASDSASALSIIANENASLSFDASSSLLLYGETMALSFENTDYDATDLLPYLPSGATLGLYGVDEWNQCKTVLGADGIPLKTLILGATAQEDISESHTVSVKTNNTMFTPSHYSMDLTWGAMEFTYTKTGSIDWNGADHTYTDSTVGTWTATGNSITIINHSNQPFTAVFSFEKDASISEEITGTFDITEKTLAAGTVGGYDTADSVTTNLTLSGELASSRTSKAVVGQVTITIFG